MEERAADAKLKAKLHNIDNCRRMLKHILAADYTRRQGMAAALALPPLSA
jgi:hypothetical protein